MRRRKISAGTYCVSFFAVFFIFLSSQGIASPLNDNLGARVRGGNTNWEAAVFSDLVNIPNTYSAYDLGGGKFWPNNPYDFSFQYQSDTGIAQFIISGVTSLFSNDIDLENYGFQNVSISAVGRSGGIMTVSNLTFNGTAQRDLSGNGGWDTLEMYSGPAIGDIAISGTFRLQNDYYGMSENSKMNISLGGAEMVSQSNPVPEPATIILLGFGFAGAMIARKAKRKSPFLKTTRTI